MFLMVMVGSGRGELERLQETGTHWEEQRAKRTEGRLSARGFLTLAVPVWGSLQVLQLPALSSSSKTCPGLTSSQRPWPKASMAISHAVLGCCCTAAAQRSSDKSGSHASFTADGFWKNVQRILWQNERALLNHRLFSHSSLQSHENMRQRFHRFSLTHWVFCSLCSLSDGHGNFSGDQAAYISTTTTRRGLEKSLFITTRTAFWMSAENPVSRTTKSRVCGNPDLIKQTEATLDCKQQRGWKYNYEPCVITIKRQQFAKRKAIKRTRDTRWGASGFSATAKCPSVLKCFMGLYDWQSASCQQLFFSLPTIDGAESWSWPCYASSATDLLLSLRWQ